MAFDPNPNRGPVRDKTYPSEVAGARPTLATRIHCAEDYDEMDPRNTLRGVEPRERPVPYEPPEPETEDQVARFNRRLREG
jgi:hypothetical protein